MPCWQMRELFKVCFTHIRGWVGVFGLFMQSIWVFCDASHTNWGMVFTVRPRKRILTGVTD